MKKIFVSMLIAVVTFAILSFLFSNLGGVSFQHPLTFEFGIPYLFTLKSVPIPLGLVVIIAFCLGIIFVPILQMIPAIFRNAEIRSREKKIRELEEELESARVAKPDEEASFSS